VNGRLLNEFLEEHGQVQQLKATVARQRRRFMRRSRSSRSKLKLLLRCPENQASKSPSANQPHN